MAAKAAKPAITARAAKWKTWAGIAALPAASGFCRTMQFSAHVCLIEVVFHTLSCIPEAGNTVLVLSMVEVADIYAP